MNVATTPRVCCDAMRAPCSNPPRSRSTLHGYSSSVSPNPPMPPDATDIEAADALDLAIGAIDSAKQLLTE